MIPAPATYAKGNRAEYRIDYWTKHRPPTLLLGKHVDVERCNVANAVVRFRILNQTAVDKWFYNTPLYGFLVTSEEQGGGGITIDRLTGAELKNRMTADAGAHIQNDQQFLQFRKTKFQCTLDNRGFTYLLNVLLAFVVRVDNKEEEEEAAAKRTLNETILLMSGVKMEQAFKLPVACRITPASKYTIHPGCKEIPFLLNKNIRKTVQDKAAGVEPARSVDTSSSKELATLCNCCGKQKLRI
jgi:hypothetical protein